MRWRVRLTVPVFVLLAMGFTGIPATLQAGQEPPSEPAVADGVALSTQIQSFAQDLERLRRFMGAPRINELDIGIRSALPRDLYFQALMLWENTDRLSFEILREHTKPPPAPPGGLELQDVLIRIRDAHQNLRQAMRQLQIADTGGAMAGNGIPATDSFTALLTLNRQLNLLLERHIAPSDVYEEITLAIGYAARLLAPYPDAIRIPAEPPFEPDKLPRDVYLRLIECLRSIVRIFDMQGLAVLTIETSRIDLDRVNPGDVYLVAAMIVSQLDFLYQRLGSAKPPPQPIYPGLKFPAHSYQRAGILLAQLQQLQRHLAPGQAAQPLPEPR